MIRIYGNEGFFGCFRDYFDKEDKGRGEEG